jgi:hypothetical protein
MLRQAFDVRKHTFITMDWITLIGGAAGAKLIDRIWGTIAYYRRAKRAPTRTLVDVNEIYERCFKPIINNTNAERVTISKVENSGGPLTPGTELYMSILNEDYSKPLQPTMDLYQRWRPDKYYLELLQSVCQNGSAIVQTELLPDDSKLKAIYRTQHVTFAEVYFIAQTNNKLFILTISTRSDNGLSHEADRAGIDIGVTAIRNLFAKYYKK